MTGKSLVSPRIQSHPNIHIDDTQSLLERPYRAQDPVDIVMMPEQLHQRNYKRALADRQQPRSSVLFESPIDVASQVLSTHDERQVATLDRLDRLRLLRTILADPSDDIDRLRRVYGTDLTEHVEPIETAREELQLLTGGKADRYDALEHVCDSLSEVTAADTRDLCTGVHALSNTLESRADGYPVESGVFQACATAITETDGAVWSATFPTIRRVNLAGVSTLGAPVLDFLAAVESATDVHVHYYLRAGTGPRIARRVVARHEDVPIAETANTVQAGAQIPLDQRPQTTEIAVQTKHDEARTAAAIVNGLLDAGVTVDEIALVARNVDSYERPFRRALSAYGHHPSVWTQLPLTRTLPYRLVVAVAALLRDATADEISLETLLAPLKLQWMNPFGGRDRPLDPSAVYALGRALPDATRSRGDWFTTLHGLEMVDSTPKEAMVGLLNWVSHQSDEPTPDDVVAVLEPVVDAFDEHVLPGRAAADGPDPTETEQTARAVRRVAGADTDEHLLRETRAKYADWLDRDHLNQSWTAVLEILDALATARPGRREHATAERIDLLDATDTWLRTYSTVVALGCVDGEWPQRPHGALPKELRAAINQGATAEARQFPVRGAWSTARDVDHFADAVHTATDHLVVTRYTEDVDGVSYDRSPLLEQIQTNRLPAETVHQLQAGDATQLLNNWADLSRANTQAEGNR